MSRGISLRRCWGPSSVRRRRMLRLFVAEGDEVTPDTVVCIIEAMKVMNEIKAETSGTITKILVPNGSPVEFGQKLFEIR